MDYLIYLLASFLVFTVAFFNYKNRKLSLNPNCIKRKRNKNTWGYLIKTPQEPELSCSVIKEIRDTPFPVNAFSALPGFPLSRCDVKVCRCRYQAMSERRVGQHDRRSDDLVDSAANRRERADRRKSHALRQLGYK